MENNDQMSEQEAAYYMRKILEALNHIHSIGVVHRDLKPENIMIGPHKEVKLIDFGLSKDTEGNTRALNSIAGSKLFMAPEIIGRTGYTSSVDLWSLGITLFMMLSNDHPFDFKNIEQEIVNAPVIFKPGAWGHVSWHAKTLILGLLEKDPGKRLTAKQALEHYWFEHVNTHELSPGAREGDLSLGSPPKSELMRRLSTF